jgi:hypothetical protein
MFAGCDCNQRVKASLKLLEQEWSVRSRNGLSGAGMVCPEQEWSVRSRNGLSGAGMVCPEQEWSVRIGDCLSGLGLDNLSGLGDAVT